MKQMFYIHHLPRLRHLNLRRRLHLQQQQDIQQMLAQLHQSKL
jgi:hypothetical protein